MSHELKLRIGVTNLASLHSKPSLQSAFLDGVGRIIIRTADFKAT
jgi:hypothetical protein